MHMTTSASPSQLVSPLHAQWKEKYNCLPHHGGHMPTKPDNKYPIAVNKRPSLKVNDKNRTNVPNKCPIVNAHDHISQPVAIGLSIACSVEGEVQLLTSSWWPGAHQTRQQIRNRSQQMPIVSTHKTTSASPSQSVSALHAQWKEKYNCLPHHGGHMPTRPDNRYAIAVNKCPNLNSNNMCP